MITMAAVVMALSAHLTQSLISLGIGGNCLYGDYSFVNLRLQVSQFGYVK